MGDISIEISQLLFVGRREKQCLVPCGLRTYCCMTVSKSNSPFVDWYQLLVPCRYVVMAIMGACRMGQEIGLYFYFNTAV